MNDFQSKVSLIWNIAELLRGSWKAYEHQDVILPLTVLRRLDCILEPHTRYFYKYQAPRALEEIEADIFAVETGLQNMLKELQILS